MNTSRIRIAAFVMFLGVALGAFGAHALADRLAENDRVATWDTAVLYHLVHGVALFIIALTAGRSRSFWFFLVGIVVFSGSLYALSITGITKLGAITPIGGLSFLIGWILWILNPVKLSATTPS
ncbi:MAG: DUF423 domain-containing protein [Verrucomicrobiales bacterium]|nr:DUF423 domain-containing protein [Verrucomicrobiales bacterium]